MKHFQFQLQDDIIRNMNRKQYKATSHWLRSAARLVEAGIDWNIVREHVTDMMLYGCIEAEAELYGHSPCKAALEDVKRVNKMDEVTRIAGYAAFFREKNIGNL